MAHQQSAAERLAADGVMFTSVGDLVSTTDRREKQGDRTNASNLLVCRRDGFVHHVALTTWHRDLRTPIEMSVA